MMIRPKSIGEGMRRICQMEGELVYLRKKVVQQDERITTAIEYLKRTTPYIQSAIAALEPEQDDE